MGLIPVGTKSLKIHLLAGFAPDESPTSEQEQEYDAWRMRTRAMLVESEKQGFEVSTGRQAGQPNGNKRY